MALALIRRTSHIVGVPDGAYAYPAYIAYCRCAGWRLRLSGLHRALSVCRMALALIRPTSRIVRVPDGACAYPAYIAYCRCAGWCLRLSGLHRALSVCRMALRLIRPTSRIVGRPDKAFTLPSGNLFTNRNNRSTFLPIRFIVLFPAFCKPGEPSRVSKS